MSKAKRLLPIAVLLLAAAAIASAGFWLRIAETPPWAQSPSAPPIAAEPPHSTGEGPKSAEFGAFSFVTYNVKNWLISSQSPEKSQDSKEAVIQILTSGAPDVIGLCEIGSPDDVGEIRSMLRGKGLDFPHIHYTGGSDPVRHLALLSRFPIVSTESPDPRIPGTDRSMQRGMLDATVRIGGKNLRFIGLHLKSKRKVPDIDEAALRIEEAGYARKHIDGIFASDPDVLLVAYGDLNDSTQSLSTRMICGTYRTPGYLSPIPAKDSRGETWTHRYAVEDSYSRIDFIAVSPALKRHVKRNGSKIIDHPDWETASDHRAVFVRFE